MNKVSSETAGFSHELEAVLIKAAPPLQLLSFGLGILVFFVVGNQIDSSGMNLWLFALGVISLIRYAGLVYLINHLDLLLRDGWKYLLNFSSFLSGSIWGMLVFFLDPRLSTETQLVIYFALIGVSIGALVAHAARPVSYLFFLLPVLLPLILWSFMSLEYGYFWPGSLLLLFVIALPFIAWNFRQWILKLAKIKGQNEQLHIEINRMNEELDVQADARVKAEKEQDRDRHLFRSGPVVMYRCSAGGNWPLEWISENVKQFGYSATAIIGRNMDFADWIHPADLSDLEGKILIMEEIGADFRIDFRLKKQDNSYCWVSVYTTPILDHFGNLTRMDGYILDVSSMYDINEALEKERERAEITLKSIGDAVVTTSTTGRIEFVNDAAEKMTGWTAAEARYKPLSEVFKVHSDILGQWLDDPINNFFAEAGENELMQLQGELYSLDGSVSVITYNVAPIRDVQGKIIGYVIVFHDVTEKRALEEELEYQARHDALTGLLNRREFETRLQRMLTSAIKAGEEHVLMYVDLDQFKLVNDTCGHSAGDELLKQLTQLFRETLRGSDVLARLGGDEFGILLPGCHIEKGEEIAEKIRNAAKSFRFIWGGKSFDVGTSIGLVPLDQHSESVEALMSAADVACYAAKDLGRNRVHTYLESDKEMHRRRAEMDWASRVRHAMEEQRFHLYYQDIVPVRRNEPFTTRHIEVLLRMRDESGNDILPGAYLPSAERYNIMPELDRWVIKSTFEWYESEGYSTEMLVAINLSGLTINSSSSLQYIKSLFKRYSVSPSSFCFEITETAAISNLSSAAAFMKELRMLGCKFALDDFGSGLSSFAYLKTLPVDFLKIDGNFVLDMLDDKIDRAMISAINDVGHTMSLQTIAEYVETEGVLKELERLDVDFAQGYLISRPQPLENLKREETCKMIVEQRTGSGY